MSSLIRCESHDTDEASCDGAIGITNNQQRRPACCVQIIMLLKGKAEQVSLLHVYHHASISSIWCVAFALPALVLLLVMCNSELDDGPARFQVGHRLCRAWRRW